MRSQQSSLRRDEYRDVTRHDSDNSDIQVDKGSKCNSKVHVFCCIIIALATFATISWLYFKFHEALKNSEAAFSNASPKPGYSIYNSTKTMPDGQITERNAVVLWNDHEYMYVRREAMWKDAEELCVNGNGHLTSVQNTEENDFVYNLHQGNWAWIGYNGVAVEGQFSWSDGSNETFSSWSPNQPSTSNKGEDCVVQQDIISNWFDDECYKAYSFICKRRLLK